MRLRLVMAVSRDGYLSRCKGDTMEWLGPTDKAVFRVLTGVGGVCGVGSGSAPYMPVELPGRVLWTLSRSGTTLGDFAERHPGTWLLGGPTLAAQALEQDLLDEVHLCRSDRRAFPDCMAAGAWPDLVTRFLEGNPGRWNKALSTRVLDVTVERWNRYG
jgi:dihydrofolate reductase